MYSLEGCIEFDYFSVKITNEISTQFSLIKVCVFLCVYVNIYIAIYFK